MLPLQHLKKIAPDDEQEGAISLAPKAECEASQRRFANHIEDTIQMRRAAWAGFGDRD